MARKLQLNRKVVNKYANRVKKGMLLHEEEGRPRLIDSQLMNIILEKVENLEQSNDMIIRNIIRVEYRLDAIRKHPNDVRFERESFKVLSRHTVLRYVERIKEKLVERNDQYILM